VERKLRPRFEWSDPSWPKKKLAEFEASLCRADRDRFKKWSKREPVKLSDEHRLALLYEPYRVIESMGVTWRVRKEEGE